MFYQMLLPALGSASLPGETGTLTFVEAAWRATRQLSYMNTVVGDPLMRLQAWLPGDANLDGAVSSMTSLSCRRIGMGMAPLPKAISTATATSIRLILRSWKATGYLI